MNVAHLLATSGLAEAGSAPSPEYPPGPSLPFYAGEVTKGRWASL